MHLDGWLHAKGFSAAQGAPLSGQFYRFDRGGSLNAWFKGTQIGSHILAMVGDWKTGEIHHYRDEDVPLTAEAQAEFARLQEEEEKLRYEKQVEVADKATATFAHAIDRGFTAYMVRKKISALHGARIDPDYTDTLLVPMRDFDGRIWGLQRVLSQPLDNGLTKLFPKNGRKKGLFHLMGEINPEGVAYVCEGFATAASLFEALGQPVLASFDAGNLRSVSVDLRARYPQLRIFLAGDDDQFSTDEHGTPQNRGREKAQLAAEASGGVAVFPVFEPGELAGKPTDFNDLFVLRGPGAVRECIENPPSAIQGAGAGDPAKPKKGRPTEKQISDILLQAIGGRLIRQEKSLFTYDGTRWRELGDPELDEIRNRINQIAHDSLSSREVMSAYNTFVRYVGRVPAGVNLFTPNPACANFLDGTLHLRRDLVTGTYSTEFLPHNPQDFITWVVPIRYRIDRSVKNELFENLLADAFRGDPDAGAKVESLKELAGAMLVPAFAQMFFLVGVSGSRKSTIAKVLLKPLYSESFKNVSFLDPSLMEGFHLASMMGKLVNANTDINDHIPLPRSFMKRFEDLLPFPVNRKGKDVVHTVLPSIHLYCANNLPPNFEKSRALCRRITIIEFKNDLTNDNRDAEKKYYEDIVYKNNPDAITAFMLQGLDRLIANGGKFTPPQSSETALTEWQDTHDPVAQFLRDAAEGVTITQRTRGKEVESIQTELSVGDTCAIEKFRLWEVFSAWHLEVYRHDPRTVTRYGFYKQMANRGYPIKRGNVHRYFTGIGVRDTNWSKF